MRSPDGKRCTVALAAAMVYNGQQQDRCFVLSPLAFCMVTSEESLKEELKGRQ